MTKRNAPYNVIMTPEDWFAVSDNPRQRDTEKHAVKIASKLKAFRPQHAEVAAAILPNKYLYKLDGHTRAFLWQNGVIDPPQQIHVRVFYASSLKEIKDLYDMYDNPLAVENGKDKMSGAFKEHKISLNSMLRSGNFIGSLRIVEAVRLGLSLSTANAGGKSSNFSIYDLVGEWKEEIIKTDEILLGHDSSRIHTGIIAAIILTIRKHGYEKVRSFWSLYLQRTPTGEMLSPSNSLLLYMTGKRNKKQTTGWQNFIEIVERGVGACEHFIRGTQTLARLHGKTLTGYLDNS